MRNLEDITCLKCGGYLGVDEMPEVRAIQAERDRLKKALEWFSDTSKYDTTVTRYARAALLQEKTP